MNSIQLEFNLSNESDSEIRMGYIEKHLAEIQISMEKVRKRLFAEVGELKKICSSLQNENQELKKTIQGMKVEEAQTEWVYLQGDRLFDVPEYRKKCG